jgi:dinuclear metal center YbgI/SA1388 family protein
MQLTALLQHLDALLEPWRYKDYAPNGLQVEGRSEVQRIVCGVSASQALLDAAVARQADAVLVHHGYFWKNEDSRLIGLKRQRIRTLLQHDLSLLAYHLPLDAHLELGNNAQLAQRLALTVDGRCGESDLLWHGRLARPCLAADLASMVSDRLQRPAQLLGRADKPVARVAWCSGGAQGWFADAIALGVDAFITGEVSEQNYHMALESDCVFLAAGHHATERYGVQALAARLHNDFGMDVEYIDIDNPI